MEMMMKGDLFPSQINGRGINTMVIRPDGDEDSETVRDESGGDGNGDDSGGVGPSTSASEEAGAVVGAPAASVSFSAGRAAGLSGPARAGPATANDPHGRRARLTAGRPGAELARRHGVAAMGRGDARMSFSLSSG